MRRWLLGVCLAALVQASGAAEHATILLYHRVSDTGPDSTRVTPARFAAHLDLIKDRGYQVIPLTELLEGIYGSGVLPPQAVALTFDDAYRSIGEAAYSMLRDRGLPFTVFVATDALDDGASAFLSWSTLESMASEGLATFGAHSRSHAHLESLGLGASEALKITALEQEIDGSFARLRSQLGDAVIDVFAYPYGEYSRLSESLLADRGLYGLAQQSGAVGAVTSVTRIPRFPFYIGGDDDSRLLTALAAEPLPVIDEENEQVFFPLSPAEQWRFRPGDGSYRRESLRCYAASGEPLEQTWEDDALVVSLPVMKPGRNKVNCTAPAISGPGYFWYSRLWLLGDADGLWLQK
ncbi:polysaccharide deacetylase [gamma proteobacterium NOR5-3]|nr:polysaccharide deacetylase [gamma proteobacterium NOR5-3]